MPRDDKQQPDEYRSIPFRGFSKKRDLSPKSAKYQRELFQKSPDGKFTGETFIMIPLILYRIMSLDEVQVLMYLWNLRNVLEMTGEKIPKGWFYCTSRRLELGLGINRQVQHRILTRLRERGFIKFEKRGGGLGRRFVFVKRKNIIQAIDAYYAAEQKKADERCEARNRHLL